MSENGPLSGDFDENAGLSSSRERTKTKVCESDYVWMRTYLKTEKKISVTKRIRIRLGEASKAPSFR